METIIQQLNNNADALKSLRLGQSISLKAAGTMLESTNITGAGIEEITAQQMNYIPIRRNWNNTLYDLLPKIKVDKKTLVITNEVTDDGTVNAATAEGAAKNQIDKDDSVTTPTMAKYTAFVKISREMLDDIPFVENQIRSVLARRLNNAISEIVGTALVGISPYLTGMVLTSVTGGSTIFDCIKAVTADMEIHKGYTPNLWLFNQPDYAKAYIEANENSTWFDRKEVNILASGLVTAGDIFGLDTTMFPIYVLKDLDIEIGYQNDDFTKNLVTVRAESRLAHSFVGNCLDAAYKDTIVGTLAAIH